MFHRRLLRGPLHGGNQSIGEQADVEAQLSCLVVEVPLFGGEQIHHHRRKGGILQDSRDELVAMAVAAAAAAVREQHDASGINGNYEIGIQFGSGNGNPER